ncbi:MAG: Ig-like domain-containing protein [Clostridia bacterium]|nr:Ig-like domain-containing protein [Clostridia bacterium]
MKKKSKKNKGITLIALVITIIILLILAGLSISALTGSGLFQKAQEATKISELKEIEEFARISYMERQLDEITEGKASTIAGVISDLKEKGYDIKEIVTGENSIIGISLRDDEIMMEKETTETITYEIVYAEGTVRYFVEVQEKDYEILFNNGEITVKTEESNIDKTEIVKTEITVESKDPNVVKATVKENEEKIILESGATGGIVEVTITEKNSNVTKTFNVIVKEPATGLTVTPTEANVMKGNTIKLTVTLEPSNATDKVIWSSSDESIATVSEDGTVTGIAIGTATITARCGNFSQECNVVVEKKKVMLGDLDGGRIIYV